MKKVPKGLILYPLKLLAECLQDARHCAMVQQRVTTSVTPVLLELTVQQELNPVTRKIQGSLNHKGDLTVMDLHS